MSRLGLVEMQSVLSIKVRTKAIGKADADLASQKFRTDVRHKRIRAAALRIRHFDLAEALIEKYGDDPGLRTLDALQLAVGLDLIRKGVANSLVTADKVLLRVAAAENLMVWNPDAEASGQTLQ